MNISSLSNSIFTNANRATNDSLAGVYMPEGGKVVSGERIPGDVGASFENIISSEIEKLNNQQVKADELTKGFISGEVDDVHTVLIATEEARLSLELAVQVRNKCVEAYKEINNMQL